MTTIEDLQAEKLEREAERELKDIERLARLKKLRRRFTIFGALCSVVTQAGTIIGAGFFGFVAAALAGAFGAWLMVHLRAGVLLGMICYAVPVTISALFCFFIMPQGAIVFVAISLLFSLAAFPLCGALFGVWRELEQ